MGISSCLARLSNTRIDQFELQWLKSKLSSPSLSTAAEEELKRTEFIQFIQIHEVLLQRKQIQNSLLQKDKPPKRERNMNTRETKLTKQNLPNKTYQTKPTKPNLPNQTYQTKPTKPKLPN